MAPAPGAQQGRCGRCWCGLVAKLRDLYNLPRVLWAPFLLYVPLGFINVTSFKLYLSLLRSLVVCDTPVTLGTYSGSMRCGDRDLVLSTALQQEALLVGIKLLLRMTSGPVLGSLCDHYGRKPILMLGLGGITLNFVLMWVACVQTLLPPLLILAVALSIQGSTQAFAMCFKAMIADTMGVADRAKGFVVLNHFDVLSRGVTICFVIYIQKRQFVRYDLLCAASASIGFVLFVFGYFSVEETMRPGGVSPALPPRAPDEAPQHRVNGSGKCHADKAPSRRKRFALFSDLFKLISGSTYLQLHLLQVFLLQLASGWDSVQDSFAISVLGWQPGDWDLANVPISSLREGWGMLTSSMIVHWASNASNRFWFVKARLGYTSTLLALETLAPFGAVFLLGPRFLVACCPGDAGLEAALFSSQFPVEVQASANGVVNAMLNLMSALAFGLYARVLFDPSARGWAATRPLVFRTLCHLGGTSISLYCWWKYGRAAQEKSKKDE